MENKLTEDERNILLEKAREAVELAVQGKKLTELDLDSLSENLRKPGATFVTLTKKGGLRGCIGTLDVKMPLIEDACEHAIAAALHDFRFAPVIQEELDDIKIEISRLTTPIVVDYSNAEELLEKITAGVDGVIIKDGTSRATFLPQVWSKIPDKEEFLDHLCLKMGASPDLWRSEKITVLTYHVEKFCE